MGLSEALAKPLSSPPIGIACQEHLPSCCHGQLWLTSRCRCIGLAIIVTVGSIPSKVRVRQNMLTERSMDLLYELFLYRPSGLRAISTSVRCNHETNVLRLSRKTELSIEACTAAYVETLYG